MNEFSEIFKEGNLSPGVFSFAQMKGVTSTTLVDFSCRFTWSVTNFDGTSKDKELPVDLKPEVGTSEPTKQTAKQTDCVWNEKANTPFNQHYRSPPVCTPLNKPTVDKKCNHQIPPPPMYYPTPDNPAYMYPKITPKTFSPVLIYQHPSIASSVNRPDCGERCSIEYQPIVSRPRVPFCDQSGCYLSGSNSVSSRSNLVHGTNVGGWGPWSPADGLPWHCRDASNTNPDPSLPSPSSLPSLPSYTSISSLSSLSPFSSHSFIGGPSVGEFQTWKNSNTRRQNCITDTRANMCLSDPMQNIRVSDPRPNICVSDPRPNICVSDPRPNICVSDQRPNICVPDLRTNIYMSDARTNICLPDSRANMRVFDPSVSEPQLPNDCIQKAQENPFSDSAKMKFFLDTKYGLCDAVDLPSCTEADMSFKPDPGVSLTTDFTLDPNFSDPFLDLLQDPLLTFQTDDCEDAKKGRKYKCPYCHVSCANNGQLKGHLRVHTGERPYRCEYPGCGRAFARNEELTRHRRIHSGIRPHSCSRCGKKFGRKDHLNKHQKTHLKTAEKKVHVCRLPGCEQRYTRSDALARHQWGAHGIKSKAAKCRPHVRDSVESAT